MTDGASSAAGVEASTQCFRALPVPDIVASIGAAHAVALAYADGRDAAAERCVMPVPDALQRAVPSRVRAWLAGRHCAARSLQALVGGDVGTQPLATGPFGAPVWPSGTVGSITHSPEIAMAVVARRGTVRGIGIDCERVMSPEAADEIAGRVLPEADAISRRGDRSSSMAWPVFVTTVFSAKESVYKCLNPLVGRFFEFDAVAVEWIDLSAGTIGLRVVQDLAPAVPPSTLLTAHFRVDDAHVVTTVVL